MPRFGVKGGLGFFTQSWKHKPIEPKIGRLAGLDLAVFAEWLEVPFIKVVTESHYIRKGFNEVNEIYNDNRTELLQSIDYSQRVSYLSFPVLLVTTLRAKPSNPYVFMGPSLDFKLSSNSENERYSDLLAGFRSVVFGMHCGGGIELIELLPVDLLVEFRYTFDLTNAYESEDQKIIHEAWMILLGVKF